MIAMGQFWERPLLAAALFVVSALLCAALIIALRPVLVRYALARPNARSSHTEPTPQGGGIAVMATTVVIAIFACFWIPLTFGERLENNLR